MTADVNPMTVLKIGTTASTASLGSYKSTDRISSVDINVLADMTKMGYS
jgi:hypothetical protein